MLLIVLFCGGSFWQIFPLRGLTSENWSQLSLAGKVTDYLWHITLPVTAMTLGAFATSTFLTKNSFSRRDRQAICADRADEGLERKARALWSCLSQRHDDRRLWLSRRLLRAFFGGSLLIETIFSLDGLGASFVRIDRQSRLSGRFRRSLYFRAARAVVNLMSDLTYMWIDPRIDFETREVLAVRASLSGYAIAAKQLAPPIKSRAGCGLRRSTGAALHNFKANRRGYWSFWIFLLLFVLSLFAEFIANDRPLLVVYKGELAVSDFCTIIRKRNSAAFSRRRTIATPSSTRRSMAHGFMLWPPIRYSYETINRHLPVARAFAADLDAERMRNAAPRPSGLQPGLAKSQLAAILNGTGSAPTIRAAMSLARLLYGFRLSRSCSA